MNQDIKILAIETSCDETAGAVIEVENGQPKVLSNVISSQVDLHAKTGGVVPEVASRAHVEAILPVVEDALKQAKSKLSSKNLLDGITHIAVTAGPGLIGSLLVGFNTAKAITYSRNLPLIPINHIEGHIYSAFGGEFPNLKSQIPNFNNHNPKSALDFPILCLTVSGGHTSLTLMKDHLKYQTLGETIDDAAGEAFDKVAKLLGLGYPGGPEVSKLASKFRNRSKKKEVGSMNLKSLNSNSLLLATIRFPRPLLNKPNFDFSFSGLKTAVLTQVKDMTENGRLLTDNDKALFCFAFEEAAVDVLATKTMRAARKYRPKGVILAGGVAANKRLRQELKSRIDKYNNEVEDKHRTSFSLPGPRMSGDNAAMIGLAAYYHIASGEKGDWRKAKVDSNLQLV